jgi:hypothetical protein
MGDAQGTYLSANCKGFRRELGKAEIDRDHTTAKGRRIENFKQVRNVPMRKITSTIISSSWQQRITFHFPVLR